MPPTKPQPELTDTQKQSARIAADLTAAYEKSAGAEKFLITRSQMADIIRALSGRHMAPALPFIVPDFNGPRTR